MAQQADMMEKLAVGSPLPAGAASNVELPHLAQGAPALAPAATAFLRVPLFYKLLLANVLVVVISVVAGAAAVLHWLDGGPSFAAIELLVAVALLGTALSVLVNGALFRLALKPLRLLELTAERVQHGELEARSPLSPLSDREQERLTRTFNAMLDTLSVYRRRLRDVAERALGAAEAERARIARELHDETAQALASVLIRLRLLRQVQDPAERERVMEEVRGEVAEALEGVRRHARGLRPPALDELGLVPAIRSYVRLLQEGSPLRVEIDMDEIDFEGRLQPEAELALYRIVQEALWNAARHSNSPAAVVRGTIVGGEVLMTVEDAGRGFDVAAVLAAEQGLGLFGMQERAAYVGGTVEFRSAAGSGTTVRAAVPVNERSR
jgi:two-component system, NarL family, sensor histidine kinase UhpB